MIAAAILIAVCIAIPARGQSATTTPATNTSVDGLLTMTLTSSNPTDAVGVDNTYTWTVTNNSFTRTLTGVILGSHWGDHCPGATVNSPNCIFAPPTGPTLISLAPGCGGQSASEFTPSIAVMGIWCTPSSGVTLAPRASISGSITLRPGTGGPAYYTVYSGHDPIPGIVSVAQDPHIDYHGTIAPAATDIQISGSAGTGSPSRGSDFTYTYQIKNAGPWGTDGGIIFTDTLPDSITYVGTTVTQSHIVDASTGQTAEAAVLNSCSVVGQNLTCLLADFNERRFR